MQALPGDAVLETAKRKQRPPIRVGIVEDIDEIREGLAALISESRGFFCSGAWSSMEEAIPGVAQGPPDVLLVDIGLPGMDGIEGIRRIRASHAKLLPIVLTVYQDDERIFEALCAGACGYLLKKTETSRILESIEEAVEGGAPMSPEIARQVVRLFTRFRPAQGADFGLTPHETRVLKLLVDGHGFESAGRALGVAKSTIAFHVRRIYDKLQVHSKSEAVAKALRDGLVR